MIDAAVVRHPEEGDHIAVVEEIEHLDADGEVVEQASHGRVAHPVEAGELDGVAPVDAEVGRQAAFVGAVLLIGEGGGDARAVEEAEAHAPPGYGGHVVLQEYLEAETLVGGACEPPQAVAEDVLLGLHQRHAGPRLEAGNEVAVDTQAEARGIAYGLLVRVVADAQVVDGVGHQMGDILVVEVGSEAEGLVPKAEVPVEGAGGLVGALGGEVSMEGAVGAADFAVEVGLLVDAHRQAVEEVVTAMGLVVDRKAGRHDELRIEN